MKKVSVFLVGLLASNVWADYQFEVGYSRNDSESNSEMSTDFEVNPTLPGIPLNIPSDFTQVNRGDGYSDTIVGRYFFKPIKYDGKPLAEAEFLSNQSRVLATLGRNEIESRLTSFDDTVSSPTVFSESTFSIDGKFAAIELDYFLPDIPLLLGLNLSHEESENRIQAPYTSTPRSSSSGKGYGISIGYSIWEGSRIEADYRKTKLKTKTTRLTGVFNPLDPFGPMVSSYVITTNSDASSKSLRYKHVFPIFDRQHVSIYLSASRSETENSPRGSDSNIIGFNYYPLTTLSVGYSQSENEAFDDDKFTVEELELKYFIYEFLSLTARYQKSDFETRSTSTSPVFIQRSYSKNKSDSFDLGISYRF